MIILKKENLWKSQYISHSSIDFSGAFFEPTTIWVSFTRNVSLAGASRFSDDDSMIRQSLVCYIFVYVMIVRVSLRPKGAPGIGTTYFNTKDPLAHFVLLMSLYYYFLEYFSTG